MRKPVVGAPVSHQFTEEQARAQLDTNLFWPLSARARSTWAEWEDVSRAAEHAVPPPEGYGAGG